MNNEIILLIIVLIVAFIISFIAYRENYTSMLLVVMYFMIIACSQFLFSDYVYVIIVILFISILYIMFKNRDETI